MPLIRNDSCKKGEIMKRTFRILRVWWFGKLRYAKRYKHWMGGSLFRELKASAPDFFKRMGERYGRVPQGFLNTINSNGKIND